jgi:hypothetical protein
MTRRPTHGDYRNAARLIWGDAGAFIADEYQRLNRLHWNGKLPAVPFAIGITAYGHCLGLTRHETFSAARARITIASNQFDNAGAASDTVLHEMIHVACLTAGVSPKHEHQPWCDEIMRISQHYGRDFVAGARRSKRVGDRVTKVLPEGSITRFEAARWPDFLGGLHHDPRSIAVDSY